jgi:hypothetical protein
LAKPAITFMPGPESSGAERKGGGAARGILLQVSLKGERLTDLPLLDQFLFLFFSCFSTRFSFTVFAGFFFTSFFASFDFPIAFRYKSFLKGNK